MFDIFLKILFILAARIYLLVKTEFKNKICSIQKKHERKNTKKYYYSLLDYSFNLQVRFCLRPPHIYFPLPF